MAELSIDAFAAGAGAWLHFPRAPRLRAFPATRVAVVDNTRFMHGRTAYRDPERRIYAALSFCRLEHGRSPTLTEPFM